MSKEKSTQEFRERTVESFLDLLILTMLTKTSTKSADDLMDFITRKFKVSLSRGVLYSHLSYLEQHGLIRRFEQHMKDKKVYRITREGKEKIDIAKKHKNATQWVIDQIFE